MNINIAKNPVVVAVSLWVLAICMFSTGGQAGLQFLLNIVTLLLTLFIGIVGTGYVIRVNKISFLKKFLQTFLFSIIFLIVWSRGSPHNNAWLYQAFEAGGGKAVILFTFIVLLVSIAIGCWLQCYSTQSKKINLFVLNEKWLNQGCLKFIVPFLAMAAGLQGLVVVYGLWDVSGVSDAMNYEWAARSIQTGVIPEGNSYYMPLYQYGMAAVYTIFGHYHFVQQLLNILMAMLSIVLICLTAWNIFQDGRLVLLVGILAATNDSLRFAIHATQVENWYFPIFFFCLYGATHYLRNPSVKTGLVLALGLALAFNMRTQGIMFIAFLSLTPLFISNLTWFKKGQHIILIVMIIVVSAMPWTIRNYVVQDRFSPVGTQNARQLAYTNDRRSFFGIHRRTPESAEIHKEWSSKYPDILLRNKAMKAYFWNKLFTEPSFFIEAAPWRAMAFYGILPPGILDVKGPRATDWAKEGQHYLLQKMPILLLLSGALVGLVFCNIRLSVFILGVVGSNMGVAFLAGSSEPRISYPLYILFWVLIVMAFHRNECLLSSKGNVVLPPPQGELTNPGMSGKVGRSILASLLICAILAICYMAFGRFGLYPPIKATATKVNERLEVNSTLPDLSGNTKLSVGQKGRFLLGLSNSMYPVKYYRHPFPPFPERASDPDREMYYLAFQISKDEVNENYVGASLQEKGRLFVGLSLDGAEINTELHEDDIVEVEAEVIAVNPDDTLWLYGTKARLVQRPVN